MEDKEVVAKLPLVFRTLREKRITDKAFDELVRKVRGH